MTTSQPKIYHHKRVKKPCKICFEPVSTKTGLQCKGACKRWMHFHCLNYSDDKIFNIKKGLILVNCPCPDCSNDPSIGCSGKCSTCPPNQEILNPYHTCTKPNVATKGTSCDIWDKSGIFSLQTEDSENNSEENTVNKIGGTREEILYTASTTDGKSSPGTVPYCAIHGPILPQQSQTLASECLSYFSINYKEDKRNSKKESKTKQVLGCDAHPEPKSKSNSIFSHLYKKRKKNSPLNSCNKQHVHCCNPTSVVNDEDSSTSSTSRNTRLDTTTISTLTSDPPSYHRPCPTEWGDQSTVQSNCSPSVLPLSTSSGIEGKERLSGRICKYCGSHMPNRQSKHKRYNVRSRHSGHSAYRKHRKHGKHRSRKAANQQCGYHEHHHNRHIRHRSDMRQKRRTHDSPESSNVEGNYVPVIDDSPLICKHGIRTHTDDKSAFGTAGYKPEVAENYKNSTLGTEEHVFDDGKQNNRRNGLMTNYKQTVNSVSNQTEMCRQYSQSVQVKTGLCRCESCETRDLLDSDGQRKASAPQSQESGKTCPNVFLLESIPNASRSCYTMHTNDAVIRPEAVHMSESGSSKSESNVKNGDNKQANLLLALERMCHTMGQFSIQFKELMFRMTDTEGRQRELLM